MKMRLKVESDNSSSSANIPLPKTVTVPQPKTVTVPQPGQRKDNGVIVIDDKISTGTSKTSKENMTTATKKKKRKRGHCDLLMEDL